MRKDFALLLLCSACLAFSGAAHAEKPFVSRIFSSSMVLQRDRKIPVWGWAEPGEAVHVLMHGFKSTAYADADGKWQALLPPMPAGGPYTLSITDDEQSVILHNVMLGDVWLCSGQSNMEFGVGNLLDAQSVIADANYPALRLYTVSRQVEPKPLAVSPDNPENIEANQWHVCTSQNITKGLWNGFSAVAYYFGRDLVKSLRVPIGLIHSSWGGTVAEAWVSAGGLSDFPSFQQPLQQLSAKFDPKNPNQTTVLYNGMIAPLIPFPIKGVIWYQGESNVGRAQQYRRLLPALIANWRKKWGEGSFPFYIVQIAPWQPVKPQPGQSAWAELQEAQAMTARSVPGSGLATTIDIGNPNDIHPKDKKDVGLRLALLALAKTYHRNVVYSGPVYQSMHIEKHAIRIFFRHTDRGLMTRDTALAHGSSVQGFAIAGADQHWVWATARIEGNTVLVSSPQVPSPVAVRYAWADTPVCNLYNGAGLPADPFRTDHWPGVTVKN